MENRAGKTYLLKEPVDPYFTEKYGEGPLTIRVEDTDMKVFGASWGVQKGNPACLLFALRCARMGYRHVETEPVWYGKIGGLGELVNDVELGAETASCPQCESPRLRETVEEEALPYGIGKNEVALHVTLPVLTCEACGFSYTDWRGEEARQKAVDAHLAALKEAKP